MSKEITGTYEIICKHMASLVNQGTTMCLLGNDVNHCETCENRCPQVVQYTLTSTYDHTETYDFI